MKLETWNW